MRDDEDQVDLAVRTLVPDVPPMSETSFATGRDRVLTGAASVRRRHRPARHWIGAAAAVTVLATGATAVISFSDSGLTPTADAVTVLNTAADLTVKATDTPVGPGQYRYIKTKVSSGRDFDRYGTLYLSLDCQYRYERTEETWIPTDHDQDWLRRTSHTDPLETKSCTKKEALNSTLFDEVTPWESRAKQGKFTEPAVAAGPPDRPAPGVKSGGRLQLVPLEPVLHKLTPENIAGSPRDPQQMLVWLRDSNCGWALSSGAADCVFVAAQRMLETGQVPGELRAAVYRALTKFPGMTVVDHQTNLDGRAGVAIRIKSSYATLHLIKDLLLDPKTGDYIGARTFKETPTGPELIKSSAVTTGVAPAIGAPPVN